MALNGRSLKPPAQTHFAQEEGPDPGTIDQRLFVLSVSSIRPLISCRRGYFEAVSNHMKTIPLLLVVSMALIGANDTAECAQPNIVQVGQEIAVGH